MDNLEKNICMDCDYNNLEIKYNEKIKNEKIKNEKIKNEKIKNEKIKNEKIKNEKIKNEKKQFIKIDINSISNNYCNYCNHFNHKFNTCPLFIKHNFFNIYTNEVPINKIKSIIKKASPKLSNKIIDYNLYNNINNDFMNFNLDSKIINIKNKKKSNIKKKVTFNTITL